MSKNTEVHSSLPVVSGVQPHLPASLPLEMDKRGFEKLSSEFSKRVSNTRESMLNAYALLVGNDAEYKEAIRDYFNQSEGGSILGKDVGAGSKPARVDTGQAGFFTKAMAHNPIGYLSDLIFGTIDNLIEVAHDETVYKLYCANYGEISWKDYQNKLTKEEGFLRWERRVVLFGGQLLLGTSLFSSGQRLRMLCSAAQSAIILSLSEEAINNSFTEAKLERSGDFLDSFLNNWGANARYIGTISKIGSILFKLQGVPSSLEQLAQAELVAGMNIKSRVKFVQCVMGALDFFDDQNDISSSISRLDQTGYEKLKQHLEQGEYWKALQVSERVIGAGVSIAQNFRNTSHVKRAGGYEESNQLLNPDSKGETFEIELPDRMNVSGEYKDGQFVVNSTEGVNALYRHAENIDQKTGNSVAGFYHPEIQRAVVQETGNELDKAWKLHESIHEDQYEGKSLTRRLNRLKYRISRIFNPDAADLRWRKQCEVEALLAQQELLQGTSYQLSLKSGDPNWNQLDGTKIKRKLSEEEIRNSLVVGNGVTLTAKFSFIAISKLAGNVISAFASLFKPIPVSASRREFFGGAALGTAKAATAGISVATETQQLGLEEHMELLGVVDNLCGFEFDSKYRGDDDHLLPSIHNFEYSLRKGYLAPDLRTHLEQTAERAKGNQTKYKTSLAKLAEFASKGFSIPVSIFHEGPKDYGSGQTGLQKRFTHIHFPKDAVITPEFLAKRFPPDLLKDEVRNIVTAVKNNQLLLQQAARIEEALIRQGVVEPKDLYKMVSELVRRVGWSFRDTVIPTNPRAFEAAIARAASQQITEIPIRLAEKAAETARSMAVEKSIKRSRKFDFSNWENKKKQTLEKLSAFFAGMRFQQSRNSLMVFSDSPVLLSVEDMNKVTAAVCTVLKLAGIPEGQLPTPISDDNDGQQTRERCLFRAFISQDGKLKPVPLEIDVPTKVYFVHRPSWVKALVAFSEREKHLLNLGLDLGVLTQSIATIQAFGRAEVLRLEEVQRQRQKIKDLAKIVTGLSTISSDDTISSLEGYDLTQAAPNGITDQQIDFLNTSIISLIEHDNPNDANIITTEDLNRLIEASFQGNYMLMILQENAMRLLAKRNKLDRLRVEYLRQTANTNSINATWPVWTAAEILGLDSPYEKPKP